MERAAVWNARAIFVTSTFQDMQAGGAEARTSAEESPKMETEPGATPPNGTEDAILCGSAMLKSGNAKEAFELLTVDRIGSPACRELIGICQIRLGRVREAMGTFRKVLYPNGETVSPDSASPRLAANYATAQLLSEDIRGAKNTLDQVWDNDNPAISRLLAAIDRWEQSLSFKERLKWRFGGAPPKPFHLDPPYGEI